MSDSRWVGSGRSIIDTPPRACVSPPPYPRPALIESPNSRSTTPPAGPSPCVPRKNQKSIDRTFDATGRSDQCVRINRSIQSSKQPRAPAVGKNGAVGSVGQASKSSTARRQGLARLARVAACRRHDRLRSWLRTAPVCVYVAHRSTGSRAPQAKQKLSYSDSLSSV